ncbi:MAG: hypothetical protein KDE09_09660, partial [Anaerolineales bacterium]|nr:hypothetical protein [Anaerolineales bacterium]
PPRGLTAAVIGLSHIRGYASSFFMPIHNFRSYLILVSVGDNFSGWEQIKRASVFADGMG